MNYLEKSGYINRYRVSVFQEPSYLQLGITFHPSKIERSEGWLLSVKIIYWGFEIEKVFPDPIIERFSESIKLGDQQ